MKYTDAEVSSIVQAMQRDHARRDARVRIRLAMLMRRSGYEEETGQHISKPYDDMEMVLRVASGKLVDMAQLRSNKISANPAIIQVNTMLSDNAEASDRMLAQSGKVEQFINGMAYAAGARRNQKKMAWEQETLGVGYYYCHEYAHGFGLPDRQYFEGDTSEAADDWLLGRKSASLRKAENDEPLWVESVVSCDKVYTRFDRAGMKWAALVEQIPYDSLGAGGELAMAATQTTGDTNYGKYGFTTDKAGKVCAGTSIGYGLTDDVSNTWMLCTFLTREEIYYYLAASTGMFTGGTIIFHTEHDYGEVPLYPCAFTETGRTAPEEMYLSDLEAAYATIPGINQIETLLSNIAVWNATPRYWMKPTDGTAALLDPVTGDPTAILNMPGVGIDPSVTAVLHGDLEQLTIEGFADLLSALQVKMTNLKDALPPDVETGAASNSGPAWNTRLLQQAVGDRISQAIDNHREGYLAMRRMQVRVMKARGGVYHAQTEPQIGDDRKSRIRHLIEVTAEELTTNLFCKQSALSPQEHIVQMQVGAELRTQGFIDDEEYYAEYYQADDPLDMIKRKYRQGVTDALAPKVTEDVAAAVLGDIRAGIADESPQVALQLAEEMTQKSTLGGPVSEAAGLRQPGVNMAPTQPQMPPLQGGPL